MVYPPGDALTVLVLPGAVADIGFLTSPTPFPPAIALGFIVLMEAGKEETFEGASTAAYQLVFGLYCWPYTPATVLLLLEPTAPFEATEPRCP